MEIPNPKTGVLKVPLSVFPREVFLGKNLDPLMPDDLTKVFTPDGSFSVEDSVGQSGNIGGIVAQTYQDLIPFSPEIQLNFFTCAACGSEDDTIERIVCTRFPQSFHLKCFEEDSCLIAIVNNSSLGDRDTQKKRECKHSKYDKLVRLEEDISIGIEAMNNMLEKKKIDRAYGKYKARAQSYSFMSMILWELLQILEKLKSYKYGEIFSVSGEFIIVPFLIFASFCIVFWYRPTIVDFLSIFRWTLT